MSVKVKFYLPGEKSCLRISRFWRDTGSISS